jgi:hypothetical protein
MARPCASCTSANLTEINRKLRSGTTAKDVSRWLTEIGDPITENALGRHRRDHLGIEVPNGRRPPSGDFLRTVVAKVHDKVENDELQLSVRDGIAAQAELNRQADKMADRDIAIKIAIALGGVRPIALLEDPQNAAIEAEYRELLTPGDTE